MTAKKKPTISGIMALEKQTNAARDKYYRMHNKLDDAKERIEEGLVEEIDGVTYVAVRKKNEYNHAVVEFIQLKK